MNPRGFFNALKAHNKCLIAKRSYDYTKNLRRQERAFRENPWSFAKRACTGASADIDPNFSAGEAYNHFANITNSTNSRYNTPETPGLPKWIDEVMPPPDSDEVTPFDLSAITPGSIKRVLAKRSSNSSPGDDGITYHHLKKMPSTHHFLATLFSKILLENHTAPASWCEARIKLIFKGGDDKLPANFRPIALTSAIGKLFHKIIALRLEQYVRNNNIIDASLQKGFLTGINGTMEHIFSVSAIIQNAIEHGLPLAMTFLDLENAFGSVSHELILDMLVHCNLPQEVISYIASLYSKLTAYVKTRKWSTDKFKIGRGVFQGDTLSPLIFLIAFNPIIQLAESLNTCGYCLRIPSTLPEVPKTHSYIYALWEEPNSNEPMGWYLAKVNSIESDGSISLKYRKGNLTEVIKLMKLKWKPAHGNDKWYRSTNDITGTSTKTRSNPHKVKGFADDLTIISSSSTDHAQALKVISDSCRDLDLKLKPPKCVSLVFDGKKMVKSASFYVGSGSSRNITSGPTKFLGQLQTSSKKFNTYESSKKFIATFHQKLEALDKAQVRGEYKLWIYKRYLVPSFQFILAVDPISERAIKKMQAASLKMIKRWLNLPRCFATSALHHPNVIDIPSLFDLKSKAKLTFLASISTSKDPVIEEISSILTDEEYCRSQKIKSSTLDLLVKARTSISTISSKTLRNQCKSELRHQVIETHDKILQKLTVQSKILEVVQLENSNQVWRRVMMGLPSGQMSFLLRAGTDTLPTPLNLRRWRLRVDPSCPLCGHTHPTIHHVLSNCPEALQQGRYTWRHDSALRTLVKSIQKHLDDNIALYADLPSMRASENPVATIPEDILITSARPDIVLVGVDEVTLIELTIPHNSMESLYNAKERKSHKEIYVQALSDLETKGLPSRLLTIEIGSLGHWLPDSRRDLMKAAPSLSKQAARKIMDEAASKVIGASQVIFKARLDKSWNSSRSLL